MGNAVRKAWDATFYSALSILVLIAAIPILAITFPLAGVYSRMGDGTARKRR